MCTMYDDSCTHCHSVRSLQIVYFINSQTKFIRAQIARPHVNGELHYSAAIFRRFRWLPCTCSIQDSSTLHDLCCIIRSESRARMCVLVSVLNMWFFFHLRQFISVILIFYYRIGDCALLLFSDAIFFSLDFCSVQRMEFVTCWTVQI